MSITRHAPDPLHKRETLCGEKLTGIGTNPHWLAAVGDIVNCPGCRAVVDMTAKCILPHRYILVRAP